MSNVRILAFAGSARRDSLNKKLAAAAAAKARELGADVTLLDLADYRMPLYDGDLEAESGIPENAAKVRDLMREHDAFLISCPEYNSSITPLLKNVIDWASRPAEGVPTLAAYNGKVGALVAASPGRLGGLRGLVHVRAILSNLGVQLVPGDYAVNGAGKVFGDDGSIVDESVGERLQKVVEKLVATTSALKAAGR